MANPRYLIHGTERNTGAQTSRVYSAASAQDAKFFAEQDEIQVTRIEPLPQEEPSQELPLDRKAKVAMPKLTLPRRAKAPKAAKAPTFVTPVEYLVYGSRPDTGQPVRIKVNAVSTDDAVKKAQATGILTTHAVPLSEPPPAKKQRNVFLGVWYLFMIIVNGFVVLGGLATLLVYEKEGGPIGVQPPIVAIWISIIGSCLNQVWVIALYNWKKWGFVCFAIQAFAVLPLNIALGVNPCMAIAGLMGIGVLYGALQIGKENKGWPQLD